MLDARYVSEHLDEVRALLARRSPEDAAALESVAELARKRRELVTTTERLQSKRNTASDGMAELAKSGNRDAMQARREELKKLSDAVKQSETELVALEAAIEEKLLGIPNVPHES